MTKMIEDLHWARDVINGHWVIVNVIDDNYYSVWPFAGQMYALAPEAYKLGPKIDPPITSE